LAAEHGYWLAAVLAADVAGNSRLMGTDEEDVGSAQGGQSRYNPPSGPDC
jgi:hypothetical protein